jgi:preprotein translocase subunit YajC
MKLLRSFVALTCLFLVGVAGVAGAADEWQRIHGQVQSVSGNTVTVKADDGRVLTVDAKQVSSEIRGALKPNTGVTLIGHAGASANLFTAQYIQQDASDPARGGTIVGQTPAAPATDQSWQRVHGKVQSVSGNTVMVKTDDGRTLTAHAGQVSAEIRGNLAKDDGVTLIGFPGSRPDHFLARYIQKDMSTGAASQAPSALPGAVDEKAWQRIHGTVSSVSGTTLSLKADDGRNLNVDIKEVGEPIRQSLASGEKVTVIGFYRGNQNTVAARFVQKDSSAK